MIYPIVVYGHPVLRKVAVEIDKDYEGLKQLIDDLFETLLTFRRYWTCCTADREVNKDICN